jgi:hypothetical protein
MMTSHYRSPINRDNFSYYILDDDDYITIPSYQQMCVNHILYIIGNSTLQISGELVLI